MLPYARPSITDAEIAEVEACLRSGWLATGPRTARFEAALGEQVGGLPVLGTCSGTAALHLALAALGIGPGDEVITSPMTWVSTANVILHVGATPVFADIEATTLNLDPAAVAAAVGPRTRCILPVHFGGAPCDMDALEGLAREHDVLLVEDAAHALGAAYAGRPIGSIGDATMFSFHPAKNLTTGEGGALVLRDAAVAARAARLRYHGIAQDPGARSSGRGPASYDVVEAGFKYAMSDLQAALGLVQLARLKEMNRRRAELAALYLDRLADVAGVAPLALPDARHRHAWHLMVVRVEIERLRVERDDLVGRLREAGIGAGVHFVPLHLQTLYRPLVPAGDAFPVATDAHRRILTLPLFPDMETSDVDRVIEVLTRILRETERGTAARAAAPAEA